MTTTTATPKIDKPYRVMVRLPKIGLTPIHCSALVLQPMKAKEHVISFASGKYHPVAGSSPVVIDHLIAMAKALPDHFTAPSLLILQNREL